MVSSDSILQVANVIKNYSVRKGEPIKAVDNISFEVKKGEILGLLGPNGAGKTTTVKIICSLIRPDSGTILVDGIDNFQHRSKALGKISAVLEGNRNIYWRLTVRENLEFFAALKGYNPKELKKEIDYYIDFFDLKDKEHETANKISRGMKQKLAIAVAMVTNSEIVLLDEPTLGLDVKASYEIRDLLKKIAYEEGRTVILTTHDMNVVQDICERVVIIDKGRIIAEDRIENLMRLFQVKSYKFILKDRLTDEQQNQLLAIPHLTLLETEDATEIELNLENSQTFYQVIDILRIEEDTVIESIDRQEINFEKIFMDILGRSDEDAKDLAVG